MLKKIKTTRPKVAEVVGEDEKKTTVKRPLRKKKKAPSTELVVHTPNGEVVTSAQFGELLSSSFDDVYRLLEVNDTDNATQLLYKRVIQSSYKLLGQLEDISNANDFNAMKVAYPYNAVARTLREYLVDLQMSMDRGRLAETILDNILRPLFLDMATTLVVQFGVLGKEVKLVLGEEKFEEFNKNVISVTQSKIIDVMQRSYEKAKEDARKALQR